MIVHCRLKIPSLGITVKKVFLSVGHRNKKVICYMLCIPLKFEPWHHKFEKQVLAYKR